MPAADRSMPHSPDAEQALLGALMLDPEMVVAVRNTVSAGDFYSARHRAIYRGIVSLTEQGKRPDLVTLTERLQHGDRSGKDWLAAIGGVSYLSELMGAVLSPFDAPNHAEIVRDLAVRRRVIDAGTEIVKLGFDESAELPDVAGKARTIVDQAAAGAVPACYSTMAAEMDDVERRLMRNEDPPLPTGYPTLDQAIVGIPRGALGIIAARPGMGKSALMTGMAYKLAKDGGQGVGIVSLEMTRAQLIDRLIAYETGLNMHSLRYRIRFESLADSTWEEISRAQGELSNLPIWIDDSPDDTLSGVLARIRTMHMNERPAVFMVDYLQLIRDGGRDDNRVQEVARISRALKMLARELDVVIIALSQLSRSVESRTDRHPILSDLRDSGAIEQDADLVLFIYREGYYNHECEHTNAEIDIAKNRHGPANRQVVLEWRDRITMFKDPAWPRNQRHEDTGSFEQREAAMS